MTKLSEKMSPERKMSLTVRTPFMIGVAGGTASGKSTVCKKLMETLGQSDKTDLEKKVVSLSQDSFYKELEPSEIILANRGMFNFDHPDAFDIDLMESVLQVSWREFPQCDALSVMSVFQDIMTGKPTKIPVYDFKTNARVPGEFTLIYPSDVVIVEGIMVFYFPGIREKFNLKLFVDTDADTRLAR